MIHVIGNPGDVGGARTELWHSLRLWRAAGVEVSVWPGESLSVDWLTQLWNIGCKVESLDNIDTLTDAIVIGFCESLFWVHHATLRDNGCRTVWVGCMSEPSITERVECPYTGIADRYVFQSDAQATRMMGFLSAFGFRADNARVIRGAFDASRYPWCPKPVREIDDLFTVGRLARPDVRKWHHDTWDVYGRIQHTGLRARAMGVDDSVVQHIGQPPSWAEALPPCAEPTEKFIRSLDAMVIPEGEAVENWPRVGLEAMALGVPLVVMDRGGWPEMIDHGVTGFLCETHAEMALYAGTLAVQPKLAADIAGNARESLQDIADANLFTDQWRELIEELQ